MAFFAAATLVGACATTGTDTKGTRETVTPPVVEETPKTAPAAPTSRHGGFYAKEDVEGPIRRRSEEFRACYEDQLIFNPKLKGRVEASWTIGTDGSVTEISTTGLKKVGACVAEVIQTIQFRPPYGVPQRIARYPFVFNLP
ncbi:MAG: hypothetical protein CMH54_04600 [Myxococcales bacterium]|nr:hypothetical protein [Myxococcales bacterium]